MSASDDRAARNEAETIDAGERGIYLYGIGRHHKDEDFDLTEIASGDGGVFVIAADELIAFVKHVPLSEFSEEALRERVQDEAWLMTAAQSHHQMVTRIYQRIPMLPAKFGSIYESEEALRGALDDARAQLDERLDAIEGCDEWAVHVFREGGSLESEATAGDPELRRMQREMEQASEGRAYLLQRQFQSRLAQATEAYEMGLVQSLLGDLEQWITAIQLEAPRHSGEMDAPRREVTRASVLVRREHAEEFMDAAERAAAARVGIRIEISGPWPAYSFAQADTGA